LAETLLKRRFSLSEGGPRLSAEGNDFTHALFIYFIHHERQPPRLAARQEPSALTANEAVVVGHGELNERARLGIDLKEIEVESTVGAVLSGQLHDGILQMMHVEDVRHATEAGVNFHEGITILEHREAFKIDSSLGNKALAHDFRLFAVASPEVSKFDLGNCRDILDGTNAARQGVPMVGAAASSAGSKDPEA
jgi:hypothetical protein